MTAIDKSIIQKVKDTLQIDSDIESNELYDLLFDYRSTQHPDRFTDDELKKEAEEKFKDLNSLLEKLAKHIELEKLQKKPSEIIPFQKSYEVIKYKQEVVWYEKEIKDLKNSVQVKEWNIEKLKKEIQNLRQTKQIEKIDELISIYKPSKKTLLYKGLSLVLIFGYSILSKSEKMVEILKHYSPIETNLLNTIVFVIFVLIILGLLKRYFEERQIKRLSKIIITPQIIREFYNSIPKPEDKDKSQYFDEYLVYDFIVSKLVPKNNIMRFLTRKIFPVYNEIALDSIKDIFIYNLLNKQLIEIASAENLDRKFRVKSSYYYPF